MDEQPRNLMWTGLLIVLGLAAVGAIIYLWQSGSNTLVTNTATSTPPVSTSTQTTATSTLSQATTTVQIALLDTANKTAGPTRGCDHIVFVTRSVATTTDPLSAALRELFSLQQTQVDGWYNFIAKTNGTLAFDHATVTNGTAQIYLTGSLTGLAGTCDDPRARAQIEETALHLPFVQSVQLYLNGVQTDLMPNEKG